VTNLVERNRAIDSHIQGWAPTLVIRDSLPANNKGEHEFIRITALEGEGSLARTTGVLTVTGSITRYPVSLYFDVFTSINVGTDRNDELCQAVIDHWHIAQLTPSFILFDPRITRIGEEKPRFHQQVVIDGFRDERKTV